jgi:glycosyltransferase involved in cell wall biosynthesis
MKILMVLDHEFPPDIRVENEISALSQAGHEMHIACFTQKNKPSFEKEGMLTIHRRPVSGLMYKLSVASLTLPFYYIFWKRFLTKIISSGSFEALHIHDLPLVGVGAKLKKQFNLKLISDLHENWPAYLKISKHTNTPAGKLLSPIFLWRRFEKKILRHADAIIVVVEEAKNRIKNLGISAERIFVVSNTINTDELNIKPGKSSGSEIMLYYAGGITYHRGLQNVILAMHKAGNPHLKFRILGEGSYRNELEMLVEKLSLKDNVQFLGYQPFLKVMEMLSQSDFAIIPHLKTEHTDSTIPHKLFQYMYAEKPVIASDCLPIKRILDETGSGVVYPSSDTDYLARLFNRLETLDYKEMAAKGKNAVIKKYNWKTDSGVLLNLYRKFNQSQKANHL